MNRKVVRKWQARFRNWIGGSERGLLCCGARRRGRGEWLKPANLPVEVQEYLNIKNTSSPEALNPAWCSGDFKTMSELCEAADRDENCKYHTHGGFLVLDFKVDEVQHERLLPIHSAVRRVGKDVGEDSLGGIYRRLYKHSTCGVSVGFLIAGLPLDHAARPVYGAKPEAHDPIWIYCDSLRKLPSLDEMFAAGMTVLGVAITGYVEGWDGELESHRLTMTRERCVKADDIWKALDAAEGEAGEMWEGTHGCEQCPVDEMTGYHHIDPHCKGCKGEGVIL